MYFYSLNFEKLGEISVYDNQGPVSNINELEYIDGYVFANIWQTNRIVVIDLVSGKVVGNLILDDIFPPGLDKENVLNGIAFQPYEKVLYVTGKNWPLLFKIKVTNPLVTTTI